MTRYEFDGTFCEYQIGDSRELIKQIPDGSVRLVVTSPPYNLGKQYGKYDDRQKMDAWYGLIDSITKEVYRVLAPNGSFFLNLSPIPFGPKKEIVPLPFLGYEVMKKNGFYLRNMICWTFNGMQNCTQRLSGRYENILWGVKDLDNYIFNLDEIRIPYISENDKRLEGKSGRNPTDVWYYDHVNNMTKNKMNLKHPTIYPLEMIERIIRMSSYPGDLILDPFLGSGTSLIASIRTKRNGIGFEIDEQYVADIETRIGNCM